MKPHHKFAMLLRDGIVKWQDTVSPFHDSISIRGQLPLSAMEYGTHNTADCKIMISGDFFNSPPEVFCYEKWIKRRGDQWHINHSGLICYELDERWNKVLEHFRQCLGDSVATHLAAEWLLRSVKWFIIRHYIIHTENLRSWPADWSFWDHSPDQSILNNQVKEDLLRWKIVI